VTGLSDDDDRHAVQAGQQRDLDGDVDDQGLGPLGVEPGGDFRHPGRQSPGAQRCVVQAIVRGDVLLGSHPGVVGQVDPRSVPARRSRTRGQTRQLHLDLSVHARRAVPMTGSLVVDVVPDHPRGAAFSAMTIDLLARLAYARSPGDQTESSDLTS